MYALLLHKWYSVVLPTSKKLEEHIAVGSFVRPFLCTFIHTSRFSWQQDIFKTIRVRALGLCELFGGVDPDYFKKNIGLIL